MNIYLVERTDGAGWDEYISFVAIAPTEKEARGMLPDGDGGDYWPDPSTLKVTLVGHSLSGAKVGIIHTSYNGG